MKSMVYGNPQQARETGDKVEKVLGLTTGLYIILALIGLTLVLISVIKYNRLV